jgi:hypothetical protein
MVAGLADCGAKSVMKTAQFVIVVLRSTSPATITWTNRNGWMGV